MTRTTEWNDTHPAVGVHTRRPILHITRHTPIIPRPKENFNKRTRPLNSIPSSTIIIETRSVVIRFIILNAASGVSVGVGVTVVEGWSTGFGAGGWHGAAGGGVECALVG